MQCVYLIDLHPKDCMDDHICDIGSEESVEYEPCCAREGEECKQIGPI